MILVFVAKEETPILLRRSRIFRNRNQQRRWRERRGDAGVCVMVTRFCETQSVVSEPAEC